MKNRLIILIGFLCFQQITFAQTKDSLLTSLTLEECVRYALDHQPDIKISQLNEEIAGRDINTALSGWLPQINGTASYGHNFIIGSNVISLGGQPTVVRQGQNNLANILLQADQTIYSNDLLLASRAARFSRQQASQNAESTRINTISSVSKAYYDVLLSQEQLSILDADIIRLQKQLNDAYAQYESGLVDNIDYKRATISLNSTKAQRKAVTEMLVYKKSYLNQLLGLPTDRPLHLQFDNQDVIARLDVDTTAYVSPEGRIEVRQLQTEKQLQDLNISYYKSGFLPKLSAYYNYNFNYFNDQFSNLFDKNYPASQIGLKLNLPIFQGTKRIQSLRKAELQNEVIDIRLENTKKQINTEYDLALGSYKSNLNEWQAQKENETLAKEVYETVKLQYDEGIKTYLELITAETDLRTSQLNALNALYTLLSSKIDVLKAKGTLSINSL